MISRPGQKCQPKVVTKKTRLLNLTREDSDCFDNTQSDPILSIPPEEREVEEGGSMSEFVNNGMDEGGNNDDNSLGYSSMETVQKANEDNVTDVEIVEGNENSPSDPDLDEAYVSLEEYGKVKLEIDPLAADNNGQPSGQFDRNPPDSEMTTIPTTVSNLFISQREHSPQVDESKYPLIPTPLSDENNIHVVEETCPFGPATLVYSENSTTKKALSNEGALLVYSFYKRPSNDHYLYSHRNAVGIPPSTDWRTNWVPSNIQSNGNGISSAVKPIEESGSPTGNEVVMPMTHLINANRPVEETTTIKNEDMVCQVSSNDVKPIVFASSLFPLSSPLHYLTTAHLTIVEGWSQWVIWPGYTMVVLPIPFTDPYEDPVAENSPDVT